MAHPALPVVELQPVTLAHLQPLQLVAHLPQPLPLVMLAALPLLPQSCPVASLPMVPRQLQPLQTTGSLRSSAS
jgi:hypothetical protein